MKIVTILTLFFSTLGYSCECMQFDKKSIKEYKNSVDFILIGEVVNYININKNEYLDYDWKNESKAYEIVIKVEKIIKGNVKSEFVYITQVFGGNCSRKFKLGEKYVFTGNLVNEFLDLTSKHRKKYIKSNSTKERIDKYERPIQDYKDNKVYLTNINFSFRKWNKIARKNTLIETDGCFSNTLDSKFGILILN